VRAVSRRLEALLGVAAAVPLVSALTSHAYPPPLRIALAALWLFAAWRPADGLVALACIVPLGSVILVWLDAAPVRLSEAFVVATLSGAWIASLHRAPDDTRRRSDSRAAALAFCTVVLASLAVVLAAREVGLRSPRLELRNLWMFLTHDYLVGPAPEFAGVADAALLLEGVALMWMVRRRAAGRVALLGGAFLVSALGGAWMAFAQASGFVADANGVLSALLRARASGPVYDVNAAGSFFAMAASFAIACAAARRESTPARAAWSIGAAIFAGAVALSGSRMAVVATMAAGVLVVAWTRLRDRRQPRWVVGAIAAAAAVAMIALMLGIDARPSATRPALDSLNRRAAFMVTGLRMIASAPAFGVGIGRYFETSGRFMPDSIYWFHLHENAHNNFLQVGGELGLFGLAAFLWLLGGAAARLLRAIDAAAADSLLMAFAAAALTFVLTWLTSHPLLVPEVAFAFWIVLGAALARADTVLSDGALRDTAVGGAMSGASSARRSRLALAAFALVAVVSVPMRTIEARPARLDQTSFGFYDWENDHGLAYRWTSRRATFFIPAGARELEMPVRSMMISGHTEPVTFSVAVNGRILDTFPVRQGDWQTVKLRLPPRSEGPDVTRIDVITEPPWTPAAIGVSQDVRVLGVQLGRPEAQ